MNNYLSVLKKPRFLMIPEGFQEKFIQDVLRLSSRPSGEVTNIGIDVISKLTDMYLLAATTGALKNDPNFLEKHFKEEQIEYMNVRTVDTTELEWWIKSQLLKLSENEGVPELIDHCRSVLAVEVQNVLDFYRVFFEETIFSGGRMRMIMEDGTLIEYKDELKSYLHFPVLSVW